ncbi:hypothetical protein K2X30_11300 [bacterium]|nr:hypothetical protein [bacterium]
MRELSFRKNLPGTQRFLLVAIAAVSCFQLVACETRPSANPTYYRGVNSVVFPANPQAGIENLQRIQEQELATIKSFFGFYTGTFVKDGVAEDGTLSSVTQDFVIRIYDRAVDSGKTHLYFEMESSGDIGLIQFGGFLQARNIVVSAEPKATYWFTSQVFNNFELPLVKHFEKEKRPFTIDLTLSIDERGNFNPAWSWISIHDCGFSKNVLCSNTTTDLRVLQDSFRKR